MPLFRDDAGCNQTKERRLRENRWRKPISEKNVLLGDIGATNARFAVLTEGRVGPVRTLEVARFPRFVEAVALVRNELQGAMNIQAAAVAVAGPVSDGRCVLTNCSWIIDARELYDAFHIKASVVNDFEAAAYSLPLLGPSDLVKIGRGESAEEAPRVVLGPGTGLGVACLMLRNGRPLVLPSEGGHATFAGANEREDAILKYLRGAFGHVSAERVISGDGLENIYKAIVVLDGLSSPQQSAAAITESALKADSQSTTEALAIFCSFLGSFAGNIVLTF